MCSKKFPNQGKHKGVQYVSYFARVEKLGADAVLQNYIGGKNVKWQAAVVFNMTGNLKISAFDGKKGECRKLQFHIHSRSGIIFV